MKTIATFILILITFAAYSQKKAKETSYMVGKAKVTVCENQKEGKFGEYTELNFKLEKIYKKDDKWQSTNYYSLDELLQLRVAIDKAINEEAVIIQEEIEDKK
ncbi:MAG: hypothetical protein ABIJ97_02560 [Bacteroidota bacterium]